MFKLIGRAYRRLEYCTKLIAIAAVILIAYAVVAVGLVTGKLH